MFNCLCKKKCLRASFLFHQHSIFFLHLHCTQLSRVDLKCSAMQVCAFCSHPANFIHFSVIHPTLYTFQSSSQLYTLFSHPANFMHSKPHAARAKLLGEHTLDTFCRVNFFTVSIKRAQRALHITMHWLEAKCSFCLFWMRSTKTLPIDVG